MTFDLVPWYHLTTSLGHSHSPKGMELVCCVWEKNSSSSSSNDHTVKHKKPGPFIIRRSGWHLSQEKIPRTIQRLGRKIWSNKQALLKLLLLTKQRAINYVNSFWWNSVQNSEVQMVHLRIILEKKISLELIILWPIKLLEIYHVFVLRFCSASFEATHAKLLYVVVRNFVNCLICFYRIQQQHGIINILK